MKKTLTDKEKDTVNECTEKLLTRKQAIRKSGYMALSAATMLLLLNSNVKGATNSSAAPAAPTNTNTNNGATGIWDD